jgi:hypothetical protein
MNIIEHIENEEIARLSVGKVLPVENSVTCPFKARRQRLNRPLSWTIKPSESRLKARLLPITLGMMLRKRLFLLQLQPPRRTH